MPACGRKEDPHTLLRAWCHYFQVVFWSEGHNYFKFRGTRDLGLLVPWSRIEALVVFVKVIKQHDDKKLAIIAALGPPVAAVPGDQYERQMGIERRLRILYGTMESPCGQILHQLVVPG